MGDAPTVLDRARQRIADRFPHAAERILAGEWDRGRWIVDAVKAIEAEAGEKDGNV